MKLRSSIKPELLRKMLWRATCIGVGGLILLLGFAIYSDEKQLFHWGWAVFAASLALMIIGFLPYKKLVRLEKHPNEIVIQENGFGYLVSRKISEVEFKEIDFICYSEGKRNYGIEVMMKDERRVFLPFFSERSFEILDDHFKSWMTTKKYARSALEC